MKRKAQRPLKLDLDRMLHEEVEERDRMFHEAVEERDRMLHELHEVLEERDILRVRNGLLEDHIQKIQVVIDGLLGEVSTGFNGKHRGKGG